MTPAVVLLVAHLGVYIGTVSSAAVLTGSPQASTARLAMAHRSAVQSGGVTPVSLAAAALAEPIPRGQRPVGHSGAVWTQVGETVAHQSVVGITMTTSPVNGMPLFAFGWHDPDRGTRIRVMEWDGTEWAIGYDRTSEFAQSYTEFDIKARGEGHYLALRIAGKYGSVLNSGANWAGCYAFHNGLVDFEIMDSGDMVMLWHSTAGDGGGYPGTNGSLVLVEYAARGWTGYPALNAFGPLNSVAADTGSAGGPISGARLAFRNRGLAKVPTNMVAAFSQGGAVTVLSTAAGIARPEVIGSFPGETVGLAVGGGDPTREGSNGNHSGATPPMDAAPESDHVCIAYHRGAAAVHVSCLVSGATEWTHLGEALTGASPGQRRRPEVVVTQDRVYALGLSDSSPNTVLVAYHDLGAVGREAAGWATAPYEAEASVSFFQATADGNDVYLAVAEGAGEGLRVVRTTA